MKKMIIILLTAAIFSIAGYALARDIFGIPFADCIYPILCILGICGTIFNAISFSERNESHGNGLGMLNMFAGIVLILIMLGLLISTSKNSVERTFHARHNDARIALCQDKKCRNVLVRFNVSTGICKSYFCEKCDKIYHLEGKLYLLERKKKLTALNRVGGSYENE